LKSRILFLLFVFIFLGSVLLDGCRKDYPVPNSISFIVPPGFPQPVYSFQNNPLTEEGFQLGKTLFFDTRLSVDGQVSCSSCHQPVAAFTTLEHDRSHGTNNTHTLRNAPGLFNLAWHTSFMQDGSAENLYEVYRQHISSPTELGETTNRIINKIKNNEQYKTMFKAAFRSDDITAEKIFNALSQYTISLVSANSKYDKVKRGEAGFTTQEQNGYTVFAAKCGSCHKEPLFTDHSFRNNGLQPDPLSNDHGRFTITGNSNDDLKFRVPSLRNLEFTSYYGHDGRFSFFRMMLQHYRFGVNQSATLDPLLSNGIQMTNAEENNLVAFLRTLTDSSFINNPRFK